MRTLLVVLFTVATASLADAQNAPRVAFEVASLRLVETPTSPRRTQTESRLDLVSVPLREVILMAFGVEAHRLVVPGWLKGQQPWVEIHATLPAGSTPDQVPQMLQTLLAERFGMVAHSEHRPVDVCELTVGKGGVTLREVEPINELDAPFPAVIGGPDSRPFDTVSGPRRTIVEPGGGIRQITARTNFVTRITASGTTLYDATRMSLPELVSALSGNLEKPVIDNTGLTGVYQFRIELPRNTAMLKRVMERSGITTNRAGQPIILDPSSGSAFKAVEALGLKLEERRLPFDVIVVDKINRVPTPN
jgi:uncharacterized protein (TIGR03435 family)